MGVSVVVNRRYEKMEYLRSRAVKFVGLAISLLTLMLLFAIGWNRFGPSKSSAFEGIVPQSIPPLATRAISSSCDLTVRAFKQVGEEIHVQLYSSQANLTPYRVEISQKGRVFEINSVPNRPDTWLIIKEVDLSEGAFDVKVTSQNRPDCMAMATLSYQPSKIETIVSQDKWIRHGSRDLWLDIRPVVRDGKLYLKDFANYNDGRTKIYLVDGVEVKGFAEGIEVRPGYLYSVTAKWIDGLYNDWWNPLRNRSVRQQALWIDQGVVARPSQTNVHPSIPFPAWFRPSPTFNVQFDTLFPPFEPVKGKFAMQYRLNEDRSAGSYLRRGITHVPRWEAAPAEQIFWTETANFWHDNETEWFERLSLEEIREYARKLAPVGVYGLDFELWHNNYTPKVKERLIEFVKSLRQDNKMRYVFDYWGGPAYRSPNFGPSIRHTYQKYLDDYRTPKPNHPNFTPTSKGESFSDYLNLAAIDVYPKLLFPTDNEGNTPNNYMVLSAIHALRINQKIDFQRNIPVLLFLWNRHQPQFKDPIVPVSHQTTQPAGELILYSLETMPASQAYAYALFSMVLGDGYILWHDDAPKGRDPNLFDDYHLNEGNWFPADGKTSVEVLRRSSSRPHFPHYWDYPTEFYALGNRMAKQVEPYLQRKEAVDLDFRIGTEWIRAKEGQAVWAAAHKQPFVTCLRNGNDYLVIGIDSFQSPAEACVLPVRLPNGKVVNIELVGNWPTLCEVKP